MSNKKDNVPERIWIDGEAHRVMGGGSYFTEPYDNKSVGFARDHSPTGKMNGADNTEDYELKVMRDLITTLNKADRIKIQRIHDLELRPREMIQVVERHRDEHKLRAEHAKGALRDIEAMKAECCEVLLVDLAALDKKGL